MSHSLIPAVTHAFSLHDNLGNGVENTTCSRATAVKKASSNPLYFCKKDMFLVHKNHAKGKQVMPAHSQDAISPLTIQVQIIKTIEL